jgi:hypothetical protein
MEIRTPSAEQLANHFPDAAELDEVSPLGEMPRQMDERHKELAGILPDAILTIARDWEGMPFAMVDGQSGPFDVLALTEDGRVGFGGINLPVFFDSFEELLEDYRQRYPDREVDLPGEGEEALHWNCPHCGYENPLAIPDCGGCEREGVRP